VSYRRRQKKFKVTDISDLIILLDGNDASAAVG